MAADAQVEIKGKRLKLSNLDKVFYTKTGFTKGQVIDYYTRVSGALLPHLKKRPLTLKRYPNGVDEKFFYEKRCPTHRPEWVATAPVPSDRHGGPIDYCLCNDLPTLVWVANMASIELHPSLSHAPKIQQPTTLAFDLDPGPPAAILECAQVGLWVRDVLAEFGLESFPKTSGSKGMQVYVPLNTAVTYDDTKGFSHALARLLEKQHPKEVVSVMTKDLRKGKVFIDWSQNDEHKTTVCVYSLRAVATPRVSAPLSWDEVEAADAA
ncbi:MAG: non-homologous end-joining DNA ligase, partial [Acidimicrobiia bacterium]|nr:non-homologous end-joining DNA ligase [Acidimicrobiia bacterium]